MTLSFYWSFLFFIAGQNLSYQSKNWSARKTSRTEELSVRERIQNIGAEFHHRRRNILYTSHFWILFNWCEHMIKYKIRHFVHLWKVNLNVNKCSSVLPNLIKLNLILDLRSLAKQFIDSDPRKPSLNKKTQKHIHGKLCSPVTIRGPAKLLL